MDNVRFSGEIAALKTRRRSQEHTDAVLRAGTAGLLPEAEQKFDSESRRSVRRLPRSRESAAEHAQQISIVAPRAPRPVPREHPGLNLICRGLDAAVIIGVLALVVTVHYGRFPDAYVYLAVLTPFLKPCSGRHLMSSVRALLRTVLLEWGAIGILLLLVATATAAMDALSGRVLATWYVASLCALMLTRLALRAVLPHFIAVERMRTRVLIAGANSLGVRLAEAMRADPLVSASVWGFVDDRATPRCALGRERILGTLSEIDLVVREHRISCIYIALPMSSQPRLLALLDRLRDTTASIYFVPDIFISDLIQARVDHVGGLPVVGVCETPYFGLNAFLKRITDVVIASAVLLMIWPAMLAIAIGIKLSSSGPIIFKQRRYGLDGREVYIYKFRTMTVCEDGPDFVQAKRNDSRVTPFGAFLRHYSLDELPQFINVIQGRMSVVGPRPHPVALNELYRKVIKGYMVRHKVKPGITGWAQVSGFRGETDTVDKMKARIDCDLEYLRNWSLKLDLKIILRTLPVLVRDRNAY